MKIIGIGPGFYIGGRGGVGGGPVLKHLWERFVANLAPREKLKSSCHYINFRREGALIMIRWKVMYIDTKKVIMTQHANTHPELHIRDKTLCPVQALYLQVLPFCSIQSYCLHAVKKMYLIKSYYINPKSSDQCLFAQLTISTAFT